MSLRTVDRLETARPAAGGTMLPTAGALVALAWGSLAFGAVYPWAYAPLAALCAIVGAAALTIKAAPAVPRGRLTRALLVVCAAAWLQALPLPAAVVSAISPSRQRLLSQIDLRYAAGLDRVSPASWATISIDPASTLTGCLLLTAFVVFFVGLRHHFDRAGIRAIGAGIVALGALLAAIGVVQHAMLGEDASLGMKIYGLWAPKYRLSTPFGPYVNRNHFAGWMLMGLPCALGYLIGFAEHGLRRVRPDLRSRLLWLSSPHGGRVQLAAIAVLLMTVALVMTRSRSGLACLAVTLTIAAIAVARRVSRRAGVAALTALAAAVVAAFLWSGVHADRFAPRVDDSMRLRREIWTVTLRIIRDFPLAGTGLDTFGRATLDYQTASLDMHFDEAHNEYLQVAAEGGLLLGVPAAAFLVLTAVTIRRRFEQRADSPGAYWLRFGATTGLAAIALQSLVEFSLQMPGNAALSVVLLAMAVHESPAPSPPSPARS